MKSEDFERLKAVCEKEGFDVLNLTHDENEKYVLVKIAKDIWEGVEFVEVTEPYSGRFYTIGKIYPVRCKDSKSIDTIYDDKLNTDNGLDFYMVKPSTESAYIEQLKAEAFKRFGEIKEGDRYELNGSIGEISDLGITSWIYRKETDVFGKHGVLLYQQGKWATRVPERVKVNCSDIIANKINTRTDFMFSITTRCIDENDFKSFLASKIEEYVNREI